MRRRRSTRSYEVELRRNFVGDNNRYCWEYITIFATLSAHLQCIDACLPRPTVCDSLVSALIQQGNWSACSNHDSTVFGRPLFAFVSVRLFTLPFQLDILHSEFLILCFSYLLCTVAKIAQPYLQRTRSSWLRPRRLAMETSIGNSTTFFQWGIFDFTRSSLGSRTSVTKKPVHTVSTTACVLSLLWIWIRDTRIQYSTFRQVYQGTFRHSLSWAIFVNNEYVSFIYYGTDQGKILKPFLNKKGSIAEAFSQSSQGSSRYQ